MVVLSDGIKIVLWSDGWIVKDTGQMGRDTIYRVQIWSEYGVQ